MNYNDRLIVYSYTETHDALGSPIRTAVEQIVPCYTGRLSHNQQMGIYGTYKLDAMKFHLQGRHEDIEEVKYRGHPKRKVQAVVYHPNATVVFV